MIPRGCADEDELGEEFGPANGGEDPGHGGDGVADVEAAIDVEGVEDGEEVVDEGVEGRVSPEIEVIGVDAAGADEVVEDDAVAGGEVGQNALPHRLVSPEPMGEDKGPLARPDNPNIQSF